MGTRQSVGIIGSIDSLSVLRKDEKVAAKPSRPFPPIAYTCC